VEDALFTDLFIAQLAIVTQGDLYAAMRRCCVINKALIKYNIKTTARELDHAIDWIHRVLPGFHVVRLWFGSYQHLFFRSLTCYCLVDRCFF
jgi:hypothetical protein